MSSAPTIETELIEYLTRDGRAGNSDRLYGLLYAHFGILE